MNLDELLSGMAKVSASDLHLKAGQPPVMRVGGELKRLKAQPLNDQQVRDALSAVMTDKSRREMDEQGYADFSLGRDGIGRFRVNVFRQLGRWSVAIRRVRPNIPTITELGLPPQLGKLATFEAGLILVGGITGSGKSTTIASILNEINHTRPCHILTIEDPVEFVFTEDKAIINQREMGTDVQTFGDALRSAVREDPDVMLLGEMRDAETFETALTAAETGHLVFGTVHSSGAAQTIGRILDLFPTSKHSQVRTSLGFNLKAVINQKLLPSVQGKAMVPACEVMFISPIIRKLILEKEDSKVAEALGRDVEAGSQNYNRVLALLYKEGKISMDVALSAAPNPEELRMTMRGISISDGGIV